MKTFARLFRICRDRLFCLPVWACLLPLIYPADLSAQFKYREAPHRQDPAALEERQEEQVWNRFLRSRAIGSFVLEGLLVYRPANRASATYALTLEGDWLPGREFTSLTLVDEKGEVMQRHVLVLDTTIYLLPNREAVPCPAYALSDSAVDDVIFADLPLAWSDLFMPFLQREAVEYAGPTRYLGRPAHEFRLAAPDEDTFPAVAEVTIDEDYAALLKAGLYDNDGKLVKRLRIGGFKQFGGEWMFNELSWELRPARESVRLVVQAFRTGP